MTQTEWEERENAKNEMFWYWLAPEYKRRGLSVFRSDGRGVLNKLVPFEYTMKKEKCPPEKT
jgi:hypothetical protein